MATPPQRLCEGGQLSSHGPQQQAGRIYSGRISPSAARPAGLSGGGLASLGQVQWYLEPSADFEEQSATSEQSATYLEQSATYLEQSATSEQSVTWDGAE